MALAQSTRAVDAGRIKGAFTVQNCVEVDLIWNLASGKTVKNVLHASVPVGFQATAAIAEAVRAAIVASASWTAWAVYLHTTASLAAVQLRDMRTLNMPYVSSTGAAAAGTGAGLALPPGASLIITLRTANAGRGFRGRVYLPGLDSGCLVAGTGAVLAAANTAAVNFITAVQTAMTTSNLTLGIMQRPRANYMGRSGAAIPARNGAMVPVTNIVARLTALTSQRRRSYVA